MFCIIVSIFASLPRDALHIPPFKDTFLTFLAFPVLASPEILHENSVMYATVPVVTVFAKQSCRQFPP